MEYMDKESLNHLLYGERWSNAACCGYLILACKDLGVEKLQVDLLLGSMKYVFEVFPVEAA